MQLNKQVNKQIWFLSDNHFFHFNVIKYSNRPFGSVPEMNDFMIQQWNSVVQKNDIVIHCGDFALTSKKYIKEIRDKLNGEILLITGNHDGNKQRMRDCGFHTTSVTGRYDYFILNLNEFYRGLNEEILITHYNYPIIKDKLPFEFYGYNIHGHHHYPTAVKLHKPTKLINVNAELYNYVPVNLNEIVKIIVEDIDINFEEII